MVGGWGVGGGGGKVWSESLFCWERGWNAGAGPGPDANGGKNSLAEEIELDTNVHYLF